MMSKMAFAGAFRYRDPAWSCTIFKDVPLRSPSAPLPGKEDRVLVELCVRVELSIPCSPIAFVSKLFSTTWRDEGCAASSDA